METEKENLNFENNQIVKLEPVQPLTQLPQRLLSEITEDQRPPLKTLYNQRDNVAGPSHSERLSDDTKFPIDTRFVTFRNKNVSQEQFSICVDNLEETKRSIIIISDDDEDEDTNPNRSIIIISADDKQNNRCEGKWKPETPLGKSHSEQSDLKNVKRSLKRPHSKELQGLKERNRDEKVKSKLQFDQSLDEKLMSSDLDSSRAFMCNVDVYIPKIFKHLLRRETIHSVAPFVPYRSRACLINWLLKVNEKGNPSIIQTACWYLDSIFATADVPVDDLQLVAAACYWIARKIHGPKISATRLVKYSDNAFTKERLATAEKAVLIKLNYPPIPIIPQDFIGFLSSWCDRENHIEIQMAATFMCLSAMMINKMLCQEYPSVIAVASVKNTLMLLGKQDLLQQFQRCPIVVTAMTKASKMLKIESMVLNRAVRIMSAPGFDYNALYNQYNDPPLYIATRISRAVNEQYF